MSGMPGDIFISELRKSDKLGNGKATGADGVCVEMIKY